MKLVLASQSTTRRAMLEQAGVAFENATPAADEEAHKAHLIEAGVLPAQIALELAILKATSVARPDDDLVLGSDQILELDDRITLSKSRSREEARDHLRALSGRKHSLHAAAVLVQHGRVAWTTTDTVAMSMRSLSDAYIESYLDAEYDAVRHNVGCYRIEGRGAQLFDRIDGSHFAILGLPLLPLLSELRRYGLLTS